MAIYIAYNSKTLMHYFLRVVKKPINENANDIDNSFLVDFVNALVAAKTHKQLAAVIDQSPSLLFSTDEAKHQPPREMSPADCLQYLDKDFRSVDPYLLAFELFLNSPRPLRANGSKNSPAAELDAYKCGLDKELHDLDSESYVILCEPVQDWMTTRNLLSITAALLANIENPPDDGRVLEAAGFFCPETTAFKDPLFVSPFKFNALTYGRSLMKNPVRAGITLGDFDLDYLCGLFISSSEQRIEKHRLEVIGKADVSFNPIGDDPDVFTTLKYNATGKGFSLLHLFAASKETDRNLYFCVRKQDNQLDGAKKVVRAISFAAESLKDRNGKPLGLTLDHTSIFDPEQTANLVHHSLLSRLFFTLCYHKGRGIIACKHCGCGVLCANRGPQRQWCSNSCRSQDKEAERNGSSSA